MRWKFNDLSHVGVRITVEVGDTLVHEEREFSDTWLQYDRYRGTESIADPTYESFQYIYILSLPPA